MFIIWICKYYSFKRGFPVKKNWKVVLKSEKKSAYMNTYFLVRHNDHIATWHQITRESEFGQKTVEVADWSISWKTKIWYEMILIFYENAAPIYCLGERLISCWRNRRIGVCTQRQGPTSVVLEFTIIAHLYLKKYHNHCVFLKKRFLKDRIIYMYTQSL